MTHLEQALNRRGCTKYIHRPKPEGQPRVVMPIPPNRTVHPDERLSFGAWRLWIRMNAPIVRA